MKTFIKLLMFGGLSFALLSESGCSGKTKCEQCSYTKLGATVSSPKYCGSQETIDIAKAAYKTLLGDSISNWTCKEVSE